MDDPEEMVLVEVCWRYILWCILRFRNYTILLKPVFNWITSPIYIAICLRFNIHTQGFQYALLGWEWGTIRNSLNCLQYRFRRIIRYKRDVKKLSFSLDLLLASVTTLLYSGLFLGIRNWGGGGIDKCLGGLSICKAQICNKKQKKIDWVWRVSSLNGEGVFTPLCRGV